MKSSNSTTKRLTPGEVQKAIQHYCNQACELGILKGEIDSKLDAATRNHKQMGQYANGSIAVKLVQAYTDKHNNIHIFPYPCTDKSHNPADVPLSNMHTALTAAVQQSSSIQTHLQTHQNAKITYHYCIEEQQKIAEGLFPRAHYASADLTMDREKEGQKKERCNSSLIITDPTQETLVNQYDYTPMYKALHCPHGPEGQEKKEGHELPPPLQKALNLQSSTEHWQCGFYHLAHIRELLCAIDGRGYDIPKITKKTAQPVRQLLQKDTSKDIKDIQEEHSESVKAAQQEESEFDIALRKIHAQHNQQKDNNNKKMPDDDEDDWDIVSNPDDSNAKQSASSDVTCTKPSQGEEEVWDMVDEYQPIKKTDLALPSNTPDFIKSALNDAQHSKIFQKYTRACDPPLASGLFLDIASSSNTLDVNKIIQNIEKGTLSYPDLETLLLEYLDSIDNIISKKVPVPPKYKKQYPNEYPNGFVYVRDAREALPLESRISIEHPDRLTTNLLLRALMRFRGIEQSIDAFQAEIVSGTQDQSFPASSKQQLKKAFVQLLQQTTQNPKIDEEGIKALEMEFNEQLGTVAYQCGLTYGAKTDKDLKGILDHYRNIGSTLDPKATVVCASMQDVRHLPRAEGKGSDPAQKTAAYTVRVEEHHPITRKTDAQKQRLKQQLDIILEKPEEASQQDYHNVQPLYIQYANYAHCKRMMADDSLLSPQLRHTHPGIKNGYVVRTTMAGYDEEGTVIKQKTLPPEIRCGALACLKSPNKTERQAITADNHEQLLQAIKEHLNRSDQQRPLYIHYNVLNTDSSRNQENRIIEEVRNLTQTKPTALHSLRPLNLEGKYFQDAETAKYVETLYQDYRKSNPDMQRKLPEELETWEADGAERFLLAVFTNTLLIDWASQKPHDLGVPLVIPCTACASGCDRTGVTMAASAIRQIEQFLGELDIDISYRIKIKNKNKKQEVTLRERETEAYLRTNTPGFMATYAAPGSYGIKSDSKQEAFFSSESCRQHMHSSTAKTNKAPLIRKGLMDELLQKEVSFVLIGVDKLSSSTGASSSSSSSSPSLLFKETDGKKYTLSEETPVPLEQDPLATAANSM